MSSRGAIVALVTRSASRSASHRATVTGVPEQFAIRMSDELARALDGLVASGRFATRAEAVRAAIEGLLDAERRREIGRRIVEGYTAIPQTDAEVATATEAATASIEEEPW
jgi:Arc/MetJ-type ribon-helix-helix transcriptional regulator